MCYPCYTVKSPGEIPGFLLLTGSFMKKTDDNGEETGIKRPEYSRFRRYLEVIPRMRQIILKT